MGERCDKKVSSYGIRCIVVSCQPMQTAQNASYVLIEHNLATKEALKYLKSCGREKCALYAVNLNSYADTVKAGYFKKEDIFINSGKTGMEDCFEKFIKRAENYDAVICTNYISAIYLMHRLKETKFKVPEDLFVLTYGDSVLGKMFKPSLTTITLKHELLGVWAVDLCRMLSLSAEAGSITVNIPCKIISAQSTDNILYKENEDFGELKSDLDNVFALDLNILEIQALEKLLRICDETDLKMLNRICKKSSYAEIAEELFMSESSVKYKIKRLLGASGIDSIKKLTDLIKNYLSCEF